MLSATKEIIKTAKDLVKSIHPHYKINLLNQGMINFIDIGSIDGLPFPWDRNAFRIKYQLGFDPFDNPSSGPNHTFLDVGVWKENTTKPFYIYGQEEHTGASFLRQNHDYVRENWDKLKNIGPHELANTWFERSSLVDTKQVRCRQLDDILTKDFPEFPFHVLKIDAQGGEYNVLTGSHELLSSTLIALHLELFEIPLYQDMALIDEVSKFVEGYGFELALKYPPHGSFDSQHDCIFIHKQRDSFIKKQIKRVYGLK